MADKFDVLLEKLNELDPKLDALRITLKAFISDEVQRQVEEQIREDRRLDGPV